MNQHQSLSGYIRQHLAKIESQIDIGIRHESIIIEINALGFNTTVPNFRTALYRARTPKKPKLPKSVEIAKATQTTNTEEAPYVSKFARPQSEKRTFTVTSTPRKDLI